MKMLLLKQARVKHYPGEVVEVSPEEAVFLQSVGAAVPAEEEKAAPAEEEKTKPKKGTRK